MVIETRTMAAPIRAMLPFVGMDWCSRVQNNVMMAIETVETVVNRAARGQRAFGISPLSMTNHRGAPTTRWPMTRRLETSSFSAAPPALIVGRIRPWEICGGGMVSTGFAYNWRTARVRGKGHKWRPIPLEVASCYTEAGIDAAMEA